MDLSLLPPLVHVVVVVPGGGDAAAAASADPKPRGICDSGRTQIDGASTVTGHSQSVLHRRRDVGTLSRSSGGDRGDMVVTCWPTAMRVMWWQVLSSIRAAGAGGDLSADDDDGTADGAAAEVDGPL